MLLLALNFVYLCIQYVHCNTEVELRRQGKIIGNENVNPINGKQYIEFLGVPYAEPPVGDLRFRSPVPASPWEGSRKSKRQLRCFSFGEDQSPKKTTGEDCLYLNVWIPGEDMPGVKKLLPVVFLIGDTHFGEKYLLEGYHLATEQNVIVVTLDYRRGILGFATIDDENVPGNQGFMDQIMALQWVNVNVKSLGGDPSRIAIMGFGEGAFFVSLHQTSKRSRALYQSAVILSGSSLADNSLKSQGVIKHMTTGVIKELDCKNENEVKCLQEASITKLTEILDRTQVHFGPMFDDRIFLADPESEMKERRINARKVFIGASTGHLEDKMWEQIDQTVPSRKYEPNILKTDKDFVEVSKAIIPSQFNTGLGRIVVQHEYATWSQGNEKKRNSALLKIFTDYSLLCPLSKETDYNARQGNDVYQYHFAETDKEGELPYLLCLVQGNPNYSKEQKELGKQLSNYLGNFLRTGNPNYGPERAKMSPMWPEYKIPGKQFMKFDSGGATVDSRLRKKFCHFWNHYLPAVLAYADKDILDSDSFSFADGYDEAEEKPKHAPNSGDKKPSGCPYKH